MDLSRLCSTPDHLTVDFGQGYRSLVQSGVSIDTHPEGNGLAVVIRAPTAEPCAVRLRWHVTVPDGTHCLGDAWERGYGDLEWRGLIPERVMPWYVLLHDQKNLHGVGVATGGAAFAAWQVDEAGITLTLDIRNGGQGVRLRSRALYAATVIVREGRPGEDEFAAAQAFCRLLCPVPRLPPKPVYGINDWYYAYSHNSAETVQRDGERLAELTAGLSNRPYHVIDAGWSGSGACSGGPCVGNAKFPDMVPLARQMHAQGNLPGLWVRPLLYDASIDPALTMTAQHQASPGEVALDPSLPEVRAMAEQLMRTVTGWGYRMVKHDFSTYDVCGQWGFQMGARPTRDGWRLRDDSVTTAESIRELYRALRRGAGDALIIGCNTIGHLSAGLFEISRTGDDTSGKVWERTRKMGPNTLAMRMPQHDTFHAVDADCVGLTTNVPWELNRQWLDVLARSGTPLFISPDPAAMGPEQTSAVRAAFAIAAESRPVSRPLDWRSTTQPRHWTHADGQQTYSWHASEGAMVPCPP